MSQLQVTPPSIPTTLANVLLLLHPHATPFSIINHATRPFRCIRESFTAQASTITLYEMRGLDGIVRRILLHAITVPSVYY
jgi:hypothetical protein